MTNTQASQQDNDLKACLSALPQDLLRTLQRAANCLDLDVEGLTAAQVVQRYRALGCQATDDFGAWVLREVAASRAGNGNVAIAKPDQHHLPVAADEKNGAGFHAPSVGAAQQGWVHGVAESTTPYTLRFTEWQCGCDRHLPADIPVSSPEQAGLILVALSRAIESGHARALLLSDTRACQVFIQDDYVNFVPGQKPGCAEFPPQSHWLPIEAVTP